MLAKYILLGAFLNLAVAWGCVAPGRAPFEWRPFYNPRPGDPIAFFAIRKVGVEWVVGCGRPGTLVGRYPEEVRAYHADPWWPAEAVTFDEGDSGIAAGWPFLSWSAWRTSWFVEGPNNRIDHLLAVHWGIPLRPHAGWDELPVLLPLRPMWRGVALNTLFYGALSAALAEGCMLHRRRRRAARGLCPGCAYPVGSSGICPECGTPYAAWGVGAKHA